MRLSHIAQLKQLTLLAAAKMRQVNIRPEAYT